MTSSFQNIFKILTWRSHSVKNDGPAEKNCSANWGRGLVEYEYNNTS